jgi:hypothetical protein
LFTDRTGYIHSRDEERGLGKRGVFRLSLLHQAEAMDTPTPPSLLQPAIDANLPCVRTCDGK